MKRRRYLLQRLADSADLPGEALPGIPLVEIAGQGRVLIENHGGVCEYGCELIRVNVRYGQVCVQGCELTISQMTSAQLVISGKIQSVSLVEKRR